MWKSFRFKLSTVLSLLLCLNCACRIWAQNINPEQNWIVVNQISCWERNGRWENATVCPKSKIVTGHRFRFLSRTGLTGIQLKCTEKYGKGEKEKSKILEMISKDEAGVINLPRGEWKNWTKKSRSSFAVGFSFAPGEMNLRRSVKNFEVIYHSENETQIAKQSALNSGRVVIKCPQYHAICGVKVMMDKEKLGILTEIGLKCCFHCIPEEKWVPVHHYNNTKLYEVTVEVRPTIGLQLQQASQNAQSNPTDFAATSQSLVLAEIFSGLGKSISTGFDWAHAATSIWSKTTLADEIFTCAANSSCVYKQLVGQCGSFRVPVDQFCQVSTSPGKAIPSSCAELSVDLESIKSCSDAMEILSSPRSARQTIYPHGNSASTSLEVLCDFKTGPGGWTVIQKRSSGPRLDFDGTWNDYARGFGSFSGNFWLGLDNIHALTKNGDQELRIDLEDFEGEKRFAKYSSFSISDVSDFYRLTIGGFSPDSTAGDSMTNTSVLSSVLLDGMRFSTKDKDNDLATNASCATNGGGWWYNHCTYSKLNGPYRKKGETFPARSAILWYTWKGENYSLAKTEIKIRTRT